MATYMFKCQECGTIFEEEHSMKDAPSETYCPVCNPDKDPNGVMAKRYYGSGSMNFILKGNDWPGKIVKRSGQKNGSKGMTVGEVIEDRERKGMGNTGAKEKPMSDAEFKRRKELNQRWLEENKD